MSVINKVRERLERDANGFLEGDMVVTSETDLRALLADHARLTEELRKVHPKREFFVVWCPARNEGFVTSNKRDAEWVASGRNRPFATPTVGEAFREAYADDGICPVEVICLPRKDDAQHD